MTKKLVDKAALRVKGINWNNSTFWRKVTAGKFPKPITIGNRNLWVEEEVDAYIDSLIAARTPPTGQ